MSTAASEQSNQTPLRTPSLRLRVTLTSLVLLAALLLILGVVLDTLLSQRLHAQLRDRLLDRAGVASVLVDQVPPRDLANRLEGQGISVRVVTSDGETYDAGSVPGDSTAPTQTTPRPGGPGDDPGPAPPRPDPKVVDAGPYLTVAERLSDGTVVRLYADRTAVDDTLDQVRFALLVSSLVVLVVAALALMPVVGRALRPLTLITGVAQAISAGDRGRRLRPDRPGTELGRTASAFDDMLDAVEGAEQQARQSEQRLRDFVSDAAHELRTPITGVRASSEHLLRVDPDRAERERILIGLVREADRAGRLVEDLLLMARIDRGLELVRGPVHLAGLVAHCVEVREPTEPRVDFEIAGPDVVVDADEQRLTQVVGNLLDNAIQATAGAGRVSVRIGRAGDRAQIDVTDDGPGVPEADRERIFDRLTRLETARDRRRGGVGLGLSIARGIARAHGGDLVCLPPGPSGGAHFRVELPT